MAEFVVRHSTYRGRAPRSQRLEPLAPEASRKEAIGLSRPVKRLATPLPSTRLVVSPPLPSRSSATRAPSSSASASAASAWPRRSHHIITGCETSLSPHKRHKPFNRTGILRRFDQRA
eukprot:scaffold34153_cov54-Phaeocystis_antarctica.AAC.1